MAGLRPRRTPGNTWLSCRTGRRRRSGEQSGFRLGACLNVFGSDLGAVKEKLEAEWELVKFMGQEENIELREKLEELEEDITDQQAEIHIIFSPSSITNVCAGTEEECG